MFVVFLLFVIVSVRSSRRKKELLAIVESSDTDSESLELLITPVEDEGPLLAIDTEAEDLVVELEVPEAIVESDEISLSESLEAKNEAGEGNSRLDRRMKRKQQREHSEMIESLNKNLPPLHTIVPPAAATPVIVAEIDEPLPPLPLPDSGLPPLPGLPPLQ